MTSQPCGLGGFSMWNRLHIITYPECQKISSTLQRCAERLIKMRLLDTSTYTLHEYLGQEIPAYAILSHRWEEEEVSLQDLQDGRGFQMAGFAKIKGCCARAVLDGFCYVWIDTCCINKESSAELSEAINSMYLWYQNAVVCYAFLSDAAKGGEDSARHFSKSKWFTRGWTLQELLAPFYVIFYDHLWDEIGTKFGLERELSSITGIRFSAPINEACVAEKMSWVSKRETTRVEDLAYCLMGLFDVHMAPLYGEGRNAFIRLQLEILSKSDDESIFAWHGYGNEGGLLANSPDAFQNSGDIRVFPFDRERPQFSMTNKGLRLELFLIRTTNRNPGKSLRPAEYLVPLNCGRSEPSRNVKYPIAIVLWQERQRHYQRAYTHLPPKSYNDSDSASGTAAREVVFVQQKGISEPRKDLSIKYPYIFVLKTEVILRQGYSISDELVSCSDCGVWDMDNIRGPTLTIHKSCFCISMYSCYYGALLFSAKDSASFVLMLETGRYPGVGAEIKTPKQRSLTETVDVIWKKKIKPYIEAFPHRLSKPVPGSFVSLAFHPVSERECLIEIMLNTTKS